MNDSEEHWNNMQTDLANMETDLANYTAEADDLGFDPDYEYIDWSEWEEGDSMTEAPEEEWSEFIDADEDMLDDNSGLDQEAHEANRPWEEFVDADEDNLDDNSGLDQAAHEANRPADDGDDNQSSFIDADEDGLDDNTGLNQTEHDAAEAAADDENWQLVLKPKPINDRWFDAIMIILKPINS